MTRDQLRSLSGYSGIIIAPTSGTLGAADLRHLVGLFAFPGTVTVPGSATIGAELVNAIAANTELVNFVQAGAERVTTLTIGAEIGG